jgi:hypothetical protein
MSLRKKMVAMATISCNHSSDGRSRFRESLLAINRDVCPCVACVCVCA